MTEYFTIRIETEAELSTEEIWPDGDAPENPTKHDVVRWIRSQFWDHDVSRFVNDWGIGGAEEVDVDGEYVWGPFAKKDEDEK